MLKKTRRIRDRGYLEWLRGFRCLVCDRRMTDAHHVRKGTDGGMGRKPSDCWCVPLCHEHHMELHAKGEVTFVKRHGPCLRSAARFLYETYRTLGSSCSRG